MAGQEHVFSTFPEFTELTLAYRDQYNKVVQQFPAIAEISFASLITWWSSLSNCRVAQLNGNLVISYWLPGDEKNSGISIVGTNDIDQSICEIFDYMRLENKVCRLVHVPEFVLSNINFPDMFTCNAESDYREIVLSNDLLADINKSPIFVKRKIASFLKSTHGQIVDLRSVNLSNPKNQQQIIESYFQWKYKKHSLVVNELPKHAEEVFIRTVENGASLNQNIVCQFIDDEIHSFTLYEIPTGSDHVILRYSGFSCDIPGLYEYTCFKLAQRFKAEGIKKAVVAIHIGDPRFLTNRISLNPSTIFNKYEIRPGDSSHTNYSIMNMRDRASN